MATYRTWFEIGVRNAGFRHAYRALMWVYMWGIARGGIGHDPTAEEVAGWWKRPVRTCYREQASFRLAFPDYEDPAYIVSTPEAKKVFGELAAKSDAFDAAVLELTTRKRAQAPILDASILRIGMLGPP